ncbi:MULTISPECIES: NPCBM/NEW2 domain-containing protein [unclassified Streptomyces]
MRLSGSSWAWQRTGLWIGGAQHAHGVTVHGRSSVTIDLNRACSSYDALVGVDDLTSLGKVRFSVHADGVRLWNSGMVKGGDRAIPVHVNLTGRETVRLVVEPHRPFDSVALADWAQSRFTCG